MDFSNDDCLSISILSHGEKDFICAKDTEYKLDSICEYFSASNCPTLAGKPKLFIIQACQGDGKDFGMTLENRSAAVNNYQNQMETDSSPYTGLSSYRIPVYADFIMAFSTIPGDKWINMKLFHWKMLVFLWILGFVSWRDVTSGSWFIQCLCEELQMSSESYDILTILTRVTRRVAVGKEVEVFKAKQIPFVTTTLTRLLLFPVLQNIHSQQ